MSGLGHSVRKGAQKEGRSRGFVCKKLKEMLTLSCDKCSPESVTLLYLSKGSLYESCYLIHDISRYNDNLKFTIESMVSMVFWRNC